MSPNADAPGPAGGLQATVIESLPNSMFLLRLADGREVTGHAAKDSRMAFVRLVAGDVVTIETSPFDPRRARILSLIGRHRTPEHRASAQRKNPFTPNQSPLEQREEP